MAGINPDDVNISSFDAFYNQMNHEGVDLDHFYGFQCWDGAAILWYRLGYTLLTGPLGFAYECWAVNRDNNIHPPTITLVTDKTQIKRGDVVVFNWTFNGDAGHIAYAFEDWKADGMQFFGQNQTNPSPIVGSPFTVNTFRTSDILGAFRYDAWQQPVPPEPTIKKSKRNDYPWPIALRHWRK